MEVVSDQEIEPGCDGDDKFKISVLTHEEQSEMLKKSIAKRASMLEAEEARKLFHQIEWKVADLNNIPQLTEAFVDVQHVYHSAALVSFDPADEQELRKVNIEGTANIVNLCISCKVYKLCFVSSIAALGNITNADKIDETGKWNPEGKHNDYAISKYGAEIEVWRGTQEGVNAIIVNPGVIIGPGFWNSGSGKIFKKIDSGLSYYFPKVTGFVGVQDVVKSMIILMNSENVNEQANREKREQMERLVRLEMSVIRVLLVLTVYLEMQEPKEKREKLDQRACLEFLE